MKKSPEENVKKNFPSDTTAKEEFKSLSSRKAKEPLLNDPERMEMKEALKILSIRQQAILSAIPDIIMEVDNKKVYTWSNQAGLDFFGEDVIGHKADYYFEGSRDVYNEVDPLFGGNENVIYIEDWQRRKDGQKRLLAWRCRVLKDINGNVTGAISIAQDITDQKKAEEELKRTQILLTACVESQKEMIILAINREFDYLYFNQFHKDTMLDAYGKEVEIGMNILNCITTVTDRINSRINYERAFNGESHSTIQEYGDKNRKFYETFYSPIMDENNKIIGATAFARDITIRKKNEEEILYLSYHDSLTGIYNRTFFEEEKKRLDTKRQLPLSVIMGDLNNLKLINDSFGHIEGDRIIKKSAEVLKRACRAEDIIARWGGDEFIILLPRTSAVDLEEILARIKKECEKTINQKIPLSISLGASTKEDVNQDIDLIILDSESNMYKNKLVEKESVSYSVIASLERTLNEKNNGTSKHIKRIRKLALNLGRTIKLSSGQLDELALLASLHDIGKVGIPDTILAKKGKLSKKEWEIVKRHPEIGYKLAQANIQIAHIAKSILSCHENWDGSGYPKGLKGENVPITSRIILIADAFEAMTNGRTYKGPINQDKAIKELQKCAGTQFDPELVEKFVKIIIKK